ncbi:MAG: sialidase family protein [Acidobacteriota bacterium]
MRATRRLSAAVIVVAAAMTASSAHSIEVGIQGRANANSSIAAAGQLVAVGWGATAKDGPTDVFVAVSRNAGGSFSAPVRVNDAAGAASLSGEQPPRIALVPRSGRDPSIVVVWTSKAAGGTRLLQARSDDGGRSFGRASPVPGGDGAGNRGWQSTAIDRDGHVVAAWLDHRELAGSARQGPPMHHEGQQHTGHADPAADGSARAQLSKLYVGRLDGSDTPRVLTGGVCYCCKTAVASGSDGSLFAAWRHVYPGNVRDIAFTVSRDGGRTFAAPVRVSEDRWVLDGCPENGPAMAADAANRLHLVWPTLVDSPAPGREPTLALFYAVSSDGRRFTAREPIPTEGLPRHPQIAIDARRSVVAAWDEQVKEGTRQVVIGRALAKGQGTLRFTRQVLGAGAVYPAIAAVADGVVVAWTSGPQEGSVIRVTRVP